MPRYYCDYCDTYLTHDSPSVRKQHNSGYKHKANVRTYYQQFEEQQTQSLIDQRIKEHVAQAQAYQVGAAYNQHLASYPQMPRFPMPIPMPMPMPMPGTTQLPMTAPIPGMRPPVLPRPTIGAPGYGPGPMMQQMAPPPGSSPYPMQVNGLPRPPPMMNPPTTVPGAPPTSAPNGAPVYQGSAPTSAAGEARSVSPDEFPYSESNH
ncbi:hypothetical protein ACHQM5_014967 [Ranunculus cassubicifolius]